MSLIGFVKKYPYFLLLAVSGLCVGLYFGHAAWNKADDAMALQEADAQASEEDRTTVAQTAEEDSTTDAQTEGEGSAAENERMPDEDAQTEDEKQPAAEGQAEEADQVSEKEQVPEDDRTGEADRASEKEQDTGGKEPEEQEAAQTDTRYIYYDPIEVSSPYYTDPGKIALNTEYAYETVEDDYFADAAFIGDSRTLGLYDYSGLSQTDFYCDNGFCTYLWKKGKEVEHQNTKQKVILDKVMSENTYGKIYVMLGLNDCGYGNVEQFQERYRAMLDLLHAKQPNAVIYLLANLHLSKEKSDADAVNNNTDINAHNVAIAELADGQTYFYLDLNSEFCDENRNLRPERTFDGAHLYAEGYVACMNYLKQHAVVR